MWLWCARARAYARSVSNWIELHTSICIYIYIHMCNSLYIWMKSRQRKNRRIERWKKPRCLWLRPVLTDARVRRYIEREILYNEMQYIYGAFVIKIVCTQCYHYVPRRFQHTNIIYIICIIYYTVIMPLFWR